MHVILAWGIAKLVHLLLHVQHVLVDSMFLQHMDNVCLSVVLMSIY